ncbi:MAG: mechanosensitive ion channel domain-containing protein [Planctomycetota bacterium]
MTRVWIVLALGVALVPGTLRAQSPGGETEKQTDAERISRLQRAIDEGAGRLVDLKAKLDAPTGDYAEADAAFRTIDAEFSAKKRDVQKLEEGGRGPEAAAQRTELDAIEKKWKLAKDRFDLAIQERKTRQEQIVTLEQKLQQDRDALAKLLAPPTTQPAIASPLIEAAATTQPGASPTTAAPTSPNDGMPTTPIGVMEKALEGGKTGVGQGQPILEAKPPSKELIKASEEARAKQEVAQEAKDVARSITDRMDGLRKSIDLERKQMETASKKEDNAQETARTLREEWLAKSSQNTPPAQLKVYLDKISEAEQRAHGARLDVADRFKHLEELQTELNGVQAEHIAALKEAGDKAREAADAAKKVVELKNPLSPQNIWRWIVESGPKVVTVLIGMAVLLWLARRSRGRLVILLTRANDRGSSEERENRAQTLISVFSSVAGVAIIVGGSLMILTELGVNIVPLMGGAAVVGLAVAFGAQNLIRDYFAGFMILLEHQYGINDVIKVCGISGQVEQITLRITVLRDLEGVVHFIPNGQISTVSNKTHEWSRAVLDVAVAYKENVDRVMQVILDLAREFRRDPAFVDFILDDPEMLGVDSLGDSAVMIKFVIKTRPGRQWPVKRELLRRIKTRFDELGIEIPYPHRTVYHQYESDGPVPATKRQPPVP